VSSRRKSKSSLAVLERAYRGSLEDQYGHIVWLSRVMKGMGADHALLLKGDTVLFSRSGQPQLSLSLGDLLVDDLSHHGAGVEALLAQGAEVFVWAPDLERLRLEPGSLIAGVQPVRERELLGLLTRFDCVWYW